MAKTYAKPARHRTTVLLPVDLLEDAKHVVGSTSTTETVTVALRELVAQRRLQRLTELDLPDLTPAAVDRLRRPRFDAPGA